MAGYSYFDYDQMTLLGIEVHSDELELLQQAAQEYDWEVIERDIEPKFSYEAIIIHFKVDINRYMHQSV